MENNIDKDIEILKELINWTKNEGLECCGMEKEIPALENVLKALEGKDCVIETQAHNEEVYEELVKKLETELETYKKIAEKLAEYIETKNYADDICEFRLDVKGRFHKHCYKGKCKQCIIDWARKEVEK